jgi:prepilin-type processing-associated H-X9-DG protein
MEQSGLAEKLDRNRVLDDSRNEAVLSTVPLLTCPSDKEPDRFALYLDEGEHEGYGQTSDSILMMLPSANYVGCFGTHDPDEQETVAGEGAFIAGRGVRLAEFERGLSQTILVSERTARKLPSTWIGFLVKGEDGAARVTGFAGLGPNRDDADEAEFDSRHAGGINVLWGDGHVDHISNGIDQATYRLMAQRRRPGQ